jgi:rubrerythrin
MKDEKSIYQCLMCNYVIKADAGELHFCPFCRNLLSECKKGIITKQHKELEIG